MQHWAEMGLSNTLLCPIVGGGGGGGQIANFGKKPSSSFNYYKRIT